MKVLFLLQNRLRWLNLPAAVLLALLQRTPAVRVAATAEQLIVSSPFGDVLRSAVAVAASLGAIHSMAGATTLSTNSHPSPLSATVGTPITTVLFSTLGTQGPPASWTIGGSIPPGVNFSGLTTAGNVNIANGFFLTLGGTPTTAGSYSVTLKAWENSNAKGNFSPTFTYVINVAAAAAAAPTFTTQPTSQTVTAGTSVTFTATASGSPTPTYQWNFNGAAISGATNASYTISGAQAANAGSYTVTATNSAGTATSSSATLTVNPALPIPVITTQPVSVSVVSGVTAVFSVTATNSPTSYQWQRNGVNVPATTTGANGPTLMLAAATAAQAGTYTVVVTNGAGSVTSKPATLSVAATGDIIRLSNLSTLTDITDAVSEFRLGTVVNGSGIKPLVVRAGGPSLTPYYGAGTISNPNLDLLAGQTVVATNDDWQIAAYQGAPGPNEVRAAMASVGAFPFEATPALDAAVYGANLPARDYTVRVSGTNGATGAVIAEIYDATPEGTFTSATPRLINVSVLKQVNAGGSITLGFTIGPAGGTTAKTILIRAIGPGLTSLGVAGAMSDPQLTLFNSSQAVIATNDNWAADVALTKATQTVAPGFVIADGASKDAMLLVTLPPGGYTARAQGVGSSSGLVIVEAYEVP